MFGKCYWSVFASLVLLAECIANAQTKVELRYWQLVCDKQTEGGRDEPYMIVVTRMPNGEVRNERIPGPKHQQHWEMGSNSDTFHQRGDTFITSVELAEGQSAEVVVILMEADRGLSVESLDGVLPRDVEKVLQGLDGDDHIGSFSVTIEKRNGRLTTKWAGQSHILHDIENPDNFGTSQKGNDPNRRGFRMGGSGANYIGWYYVK